MKIFHHICCFSLFLVLTGCAKESQELVLDNGYIINEGGEGVKDYRGNFEGRYLMQCVIQGTAFAKNISIRIMPTRQGYVYLDSLFESGTLDEYKGPQIIAEITPSGDISFDEQGRPYRMYTYSYPEIHVYSKGIGSIKADSTIKLDYYIDEADSRGDKLCNCFGKRDK